MDNPKNILAICGSTRQQSSNHYLVNAIAAFFADQLRITLFESIALLPHFNPDLDQADAPPTVTGFRQQLKAADGVIICTPEYAHGVPGSLKNAIDWTVSSGEFSGKPTVLITASTDGRHGHAALLEILQTIEAKNVDQLQLLVPFIKAKFDGNNRLTDEATITDLTQLIRNFIHSIG